MAIGGFEILKFLTMLAMPMGLLGCGVVVFCVLVVLGWRRLARIALAIGIAPALLLSVEPIGDGLLRSLEDEARAAASGVPNCCYDYIVVLGAGVVVAAPPLRPTPELTDTSDRLWYAARLFRSGTAPRLVVSGGSYAGQHGRPSQPESEAMRELLVDFGVPADRIVMESRALNTIENIRNVRALVGDGKVALVTSAFHMPRAMKLARKAGLNVAAFPTDWRVVPSEMAWWEILPPSIDSLWNGSIAVREYLALLFDRRDSGAAQ